MLILTTRMDESEHYHIGYIRPDGSGITSVSEGHQHEIAMQLSPETGDPIFIIQPAIGHSHEHTKYAVPEKGEPVFDEKELIIRYKNMFETAKSIEEDEGNLVDAASSEDFYCGRQWTDTDKQELEKARRAVLTINEIKPKCDTLTGYYSRTMTDIKLLPEESGDQSTADILNFKMKNTINRQKWVDKEKRCKSEAIRVGRGACRIRPVVNRYGAMETQMEQKRWDAVFFGPHQEPDGSDCEYAGIFVDVSEDELRRTYPDKAEEISENTMGYSLNIPGESFTASHGTGGTKFYDQGTKKYRIIEIEYRENKTSKSIVNVKHGFSFNITDAPKEHVSQLKTISELSSIEYLSYDIYWAVFADNVLLKREKSLLPEISIVPWYCNFVNGRWWGKIYDGMDSQKELNKNRSSMVDIVTQASLYGVGYSASAFENTRDQKDFEDKRKSPGFSAKFADGFKEHIHVFENGRFPTERANVSELSIQSMQSTMGVNPQMQGLSDQSQESGSAMMFKKEQGFLGNEFMSDNFSASKSRVGKLLIYCIQAIETPESLIRLAETQGNGKNLRNQEPFEVYPKLSEGELMEVAVQMGLISEPLMMQIQEGEQIPELPIILGQAQMKINQDKRQKLLELLGNFDIQDYDVTVAEAQYSPNYMAASSMVMESVFRGDPNKPADLIIQTSPYVPEKIKQQLAARAQAQLEAQQQNEQAKLAMESKKLDVQMQSTMIAAQSRVKSDNNNKQVPMAR